VGLTETLATGGTFTIFAPTNKAFQQKRKQLEAISDADLKKVHC
jgi:uncharacterized surface protein with fasciclin (FAS1) repeats